MLGNPGKRALPAKGTLVVLPAATGPPDPHRPLGQAGRDLWNRVWTSGAVWLAPNVDSETLLIVCEQIDERQALRVQVLREGNWRDRSGLRALDNQILSGLAVLGFNPVDRSRLGAAEVKTTSRLDELLARRAARGD
jgi:hypothetical protein